MKLIVLVFLCALAIAQQSFGPDGGNDYFLLKPGLRLHYACGKEAVVSSVLNETEMVDGVRTRVIEDRETKNGKLTEITRDYYAFDAATKNVHYFGEDVDVYKNGKVTGHKGSWRSGRNGAKFGLMMPGELKVGHKFQQEQAPGVAMDRAEIVSVNETVTTPAGTFRNCVHMKEVGEDKWYAPGVGLVKDGKLVLVKIERP